MNILLTSSSKQFLRDTFSRNQSSKRKLRILSAKLLPRGVSRENLGKRTSQQGDNSFYQDSFQFKRKTNDTQNIESLDPVVLKYTKFLSDLKAPNIEQRYVTRFGAIRFDEENIPKVHGQYDESLRRSEKEEQHCEESPEIPQLTEQVEEADQLNYVDEYYFGQAMDRSSMDNTSGGFTNIENIGMTQSSADIRESSACGVKGSTENFIDDVYFGDILGSSMSSYENVEAQDTKTFSKEDKSKKEPFSASLKHSEYKDKESLSSTWSEEVKDMNFIDNYYFGDSLIELNIKSDNVKHDIEKHIGVHESKIQKDFMKDAVENDNDKTKYSCTSSVKNISEQETGKRTADTDEVFNFVEVSKKENIDVGLGLESSRALKTQQQKGTLADVNEEEFEVVKKQLFPSENTIQVHESNETIIPKLDKSVDIENPKSAYDYVRKLRKEHYLKDESDNEVKRDGTNDRGYKKLVKLKFEIGRLTKGEMVHYLKKSILYDNYGIIGLYKPFGLPVQEGSGQHKFTLTGLLPDLAKLLKVEKIHVVHRLDIGTTGVILLSRTEEMANTLRKMLHDHKVVKTYWAITKGIPHPLQGLIDIPMEEGMIDGRRRMVLRPNIEGLQSNRNSAQLALTKYKVLSFGTSCALVEINPVTGVKHQIRAHLGFGLGCPVIGDHKYSHLKKLAPQRLPGDLLQCLKIPQSRVRDLPIFLHARSVLLPEVVDGRNVLIKAAAPAMFSKALSIMKISKRKETD